MVPALSVSKSAHGGLVEAVVGRYLPLLPQVAANGNDLLIRQLVKAVTFAGLPRPVTLFIRVIFGACSPSKVASAAVGSVAIAVSAFGSGRARPEERGSHEGVDVPSAPNAVNTKADAEISPLRVDETGSQPARDAPDAPSARVARSRLATHSPEVAHREEKLKANHGFPDFFHTKEYAMTAQQLQQGNEVAICRFVAG